MIEDGKKVSVEYTLKLEDGSTADSNVGRDPLVYEQGAQEILPAFERAVSGMALDETSEFVLSPDEGYGPVDPALRQEVRSEVVPEEARHAGAQLISQDAQGNQRPVRVHEVRGESVVLDLNHPLAGRTLHFQVKVVGIA